MSKISLFPADAPWEKTLESIRRDGAIIIDGLIDPQTVAALRRETDPYMDVTQNGPDEFAGFLTTRTGGLVMRSAGCRDLIQNELILKLYPAGRPQQILGPEAVRRNLPIDAHVVQAQGGVEIDRQDDHLAHRDLAI